MKNMSNIIAKSGEAMKVFKHGIILIVFIMTILILWAKPTFAMDNLRQTKEGRTTAKIAWDRSEGEVKYKVTVNVRERKTTWYVLDGKVQRWSTNYESLPDIQIETDETSAEIKGLVGGETAYCSVTAYDEYDDWVDYGYIQLSTLPGKMRAPYVHMAVFSSSLDFYTGRPTRVNSYTLRCYVQQQSLADGYEIQVLDTNGKKVTTKTVEGSCLSTGITGLTGTQYFVKMRAFRKIKGKKVFGKWSSLACALVQPTCQARRNGKNVEIRWNKIDGATEYDIYMIGKTKGTFTKVKTVKGGKTSAIIKKLNGKKFKSGKTYYYFVIAKRKLKSGYYISSARMYNWFKIQV